MKSSKEMHIIEPLSKEVLEKELANNAVLIKKAQRGSFHIYTFSGKDSRSLLKEVGRLREITFREAGGGTGMSCDLDKYDECSEYPNGFHQLIIWDQQEQEIVGGYRYAPMKKFVDSHQYIKSPTLELFDISQDFFDDYISKTIELGRSFVQPAYQKNIYALENLFEGLGSLVIHYPDQEYFFGKITMYPSYNRQARNLILYYMKKQYPDHDCLLMPKEELMSYGLEDEIKLLDELFERNSNSQDLKVLQTAIKSIKEGIAIPPLFKKYMELSPTMKYFGTAVNNHFGEVEESAILIKIADINEDQKARYIAPHKTI